MKGVLLQILFAFKRDSVFVCTTLLTLCCTFFAIFLGSNSVVEAQEAKIIYAAGFSRIVIILGFMTFIVFYIKRMFENHEIEVLLSHAISRTSILIAMFIGFSIVFFTLIVPINLILILLKTNIVNTMVWSFSVYFEGLLTISFSLCCALIINSFIHSLSACFIMYLTGRIIGNFVAYLCLSINADFKSVLEVLLKTLSLFVPRLDIFGKTSWLIYGNFTIGDVILFVSQAIVFCCIFLSIASLDLRKKEF